jgi:hypothetical protein
LLDVGAAVIYRGAGVSELCIVHDGRTEVPGGVYDGSVFSASEKSTLKPFAQLLLVRQSVKKSASREKMIRFVLHSIKI